MDTNIWEYISYTSIRRSMKDRGALRVTLAGGPAKASVTISRRMNHVFRKYLACVYGRPFSLPAPAGDQDNAAPQNSASARQ